MKRCPEEHQFLVPWRRIYKNQIGLGTIIEKILNIMGKLPHINLSIMPAMVPLAVVAKCLQSYVRLS